MEFGQYLHDIIRARSRRSELELELDLQSVAALRAFAEIHAKIGGGEGSNTQGSKEDENVSCTPSMNARTWSPPMHRCSEESTGMLDTLAGPSGTDDRVTPLPQMDLPVASAAHNTGGDNSLSHWVRNTIQPKNSAPLTERNVTRANDIVKNRLRSSNSAAANVCIREDKSSICSADQTIPLGNTACSATRSRSVT